MTERTGYGPHGPDGISWETEDYINGNVAETQAIIDSLEAHAVSSTLTPEQVRKAIDHMIRALVYENRDPFSPQQRGSYELLHVAGSYIGEIDRRYGQEFYRLGKDLLQRMPIGALHRLLKARGLSSESTPETEAVYKALGVRAQKRDARLQKFQSEPDPFAEPEPIVLDEGIEISLTDWLLNPDEV